jgi:hypothetical protein
MQCKNIIGVFGAEGPADICESLGFAESVSGN